MSVQQTILRGRLALDHVREAGDWPATAEAMLGDVAAAIGAHAGVVGTATVVLSDDAHVRTLNARFRDMDQPTNVLSFPSGDSAGQDAYLGDVILAFETLVREAADMTRPIEHHFAHLVVHGILHLAGHDHDDDEEAVAMERLEAAVLAALSIPDPYEDAPLAAGA